MKRSETATYRLASKSRRFISFAAGPLGSRTSADFNNAISASRLQNPAYTFKRKQHFIKKKQELIRGPAAKEMRRLFLEATYRQ